MVNKTISVPEDVVPIIESLDQPFSHWVTEQLRRHAAEEGTTFSQQLLKDADLARTRRPSRQESIQTGQRMERTAPW